MARSIADNIVCKSELPRPGWSLELISDVNSVGLPIELLSHNMPHVFKMADRIHIHRLGRRLCVIDPKEHSMSDAVAYMTGAKTPENTSAA